MLSSKVDLKLDTNSVGKSWIKPTVSVKVTWRFPPRWILLVVASRVAKSSSASYWVFLVQVFMIVDFPALVSPIKPILKVLDSKRFSLTVARFFSTTLSWRSISVI